MSKTVLVVDDEVNIVTSLEYVMTAAGFDVATAYDGEEALTKIAEIVPDLVI
ncbi:MAG: two-component system response regulator, partial [Gammaproteobacteria bacterium]